MTASVRVLMITVRADHGGGPKHLELLLRGLPSHIEPYVAAPDERPYGPIFASLIQRDIFPIPHRAFSINHALRLASHVREHDIALIHSHGKGAGAYARLVSLLTGRPTVHTPHGVHMGGHSCLYRIAYRAYENLTAARISQLLYVSNDERVAAQRQRLWQRVEHSVVPNGVRAIPDRVVEQLRLQAKHAIDVPAARRAVVTVTRFDYQKNMDEAFEVARRLPHLEFIWIGDGPDFERLKDRLLREQVRNVQMVGPMDDPNTLLAGAACYLSTSRWEGLPLAVLEAMALGVPVIGSDVTGHRDLIAEADCGRLYPPGSPDRAASLVDQITSNTALGESLGHNGRVAQRAHYSADVMASRIAAIYGRLTR